MKMTNEYNADHAAQLEAELAHAEQAAELEANGDTVEVEEAAENVVAKAPKKDFKQRTLFVVEDENGVEHEFRSKPELDAFLAKPRVKRAIEAIEGATPEFVKFVIDNEAAIKAAYAIASPEKKKREIAPETREKMRAAMLERISSGKITPIAKKEA